LTGAVGRYRAVTQPSQVIHTVEIDTIVIGSSMETHHVDLVRVDNFRPLPEPASARSAERGLVRTGFVGAPSPARAEPRRAQAEQSRVPTPFAWFAHVWRWPGWDHYRVRGRSGGRPRPGGTPVRDETVAAGCHAPGGGPISAPDCHAYVQDQRNRDIAAIFGRHVPVSMITPSRPC
jgi:hypothetical protein